MPGHASWSSFLFPMSVAARAGEAAFRAFAGLLADEDGAAEMAPPPDWSTPNGVRLELASMRLREFAAGEPGALPCLVVTPLALHGAIIADLAPGHSVMERLLGQGRAPLHLVECRTATPQLRYLSIDSYLADLSVAIDDLGGRVHLVGLCQGGWLALMLAARFPGKAASLVLAGAPVDLAASPSRIVEATRATPPELFDALVEAGGGLVLGRMMQAFWRANEPNEQEIARILQDRSPSPELLARFAAWDAFTLDMPGVYYRETVERLFRRNELAAGSFLALGRRLDLAAVECPLVILAGSEDEVVPPEQALAAAGLVGTRPESIETIVTPAPHLGLFMGAGAIAGPWGEIAAWLHGQGWGGRAGAARRQRRRLAQA